MLQYAFMQRALLAALLVGLTAPVVGVYLVQRRLALIGDGLGHVALTGVALGVLTGQAPVVVALAFTLQQADAWFAYYPTVADLVRAPLPDQASLAQLQSAGRAARFPSSTRCWPGNRCCGGRCGSFSTIRRSTASGW